MSTIQITNSTILYVLFSHLISVAFENTNLYIVIKKIYTQKWYISIMMSNYMRAIFQHIKQGKSTYQSCVDRTLEEIKHYALSSILVYIKLFALSIIDADCQFTV